MLGALIWPLVPWILNVILFVYWGASAIFLASMGEPQGSVIMNGTNETIEDSNLDQLVNKATDIIPCDPGVWSYNILPRPSLQCSRYLFALCRKTRLPEVCVRS